MINRIEIRDGQVVVVPREPTEYSLPVQAAVRAAVGRVAYMNNTTASPKAGWQIGDLHPIGSDGPLMGLLDSLREEMTNEGAVESMPAAETPLALLALCGAGAECWSWMTESGSKPAAERVINSLKAASAVTDVLATLTDGMQAIKPTLTVLGFAVKAGEQVYVYLKERERKQKS
jgi:hypothetical protein